MGKTKAEWVKLSDRWPKFEFSDSQGMFKNLAEGQKQVPMRMKMSVL
jgi:hypothetical protein